MIAVREWQELPVPPCAEEAGLAGPMLMEGASVDVERQANEELPLDDLR